METPGGGEVVSQREFAEWRRRNFPEGNDGYDLLTHKLSPKDTKGRNRFEQVHKLLLDIAYLNDEQRYTPKEALEEVLTAKRTKWNLPKPTDLIRNRQLQDFVAKFLVFYKEQRAKAISESNNKTTSSSSDVANTLNAKNKQDSEDE